MNPMMWDIERALRLIKVLALHLEAAGWGVGLAGSVLLEGSSSNDLDLIVYPLNSSEVSFEALHGALRAADLVLLFDADYVHKMWRRRGSSATADYKHVEVWGDGTDRKDSRKIDIFVLR